MPEENYTKEELEQDGWMCEKCRRKLYYTGEVTLCQICEEYFEELEQDDLQWFGGLKCQKKKN